MIAPLDRYRLNFAQGDFRPRLFEPPDAEVCEWLIGLYRKYSEELVELSEQMARKYVAMLEAGYGTVVADIEGELLYLLVREYRPELIYEISPNAGFSTNYLLAAATRNGTGRMEGFEIIPEFFGIPVEQVIRSNLIDLCDGSRYHVNVGDARVTVPERLRHESPDFTFIDSCHDDFFAEFYVKELLPRCRKIVFAQDICHFDPRPEHSTEAYYLLSFLQETGTRFLSVGAYEDDLNASGLRDRLRPCLSLRSDSVIVCLADQPERMEPPGRALLELAKAGGDSVQTLRAPQAYRTLPLNAARVIPGFFESVDVTASDRPEDRYAAVWYGAVAPREPLSFLDIFALQLGKGSITTRLERVMAEGFASYDPWCRLLILEALAAARRWETVRGLLTEVDDGAIRGAEIPLRLARVALAAGRKDMVLAWLERCRRAASDTSLAAGFRNLLASASLLIKAHEPSMARKAFREALIQVNRRAYSLAVNRKANHREIFFFCVRHPSFLPLLAGAGLDHSQWRHVPRQVFRAIKGRLARI